METPETSTPQLKIPCRNLRCKEMYYHGQPDDECASGIYWCSKTTENFGPDGEPAGKTECCAERSCYVG